MIHHISNNDNATTLCARDEPPFIPGGWVARYLATKDLEWCDECMTIFKRRNTTS